MIASVLAMPQANPTPNASAPGRLHGSTKSDAAKPIVADFAAVDHFQRE